jgi:hypothetical protein
MSRSQSMLRKVRSMGLIILVTIGALVRMTLMLMKQQLTGDLPEFNVTLEDEVDDVKDNGVHVIGFLYDGIWWHLTALDDGN